MAKGKAKINSSEELPPLQTRSRKSRKRESPSEESSLTADVQTTVHQKATESSGLPKQDDLTKEKHTEAMDVAGQEETAVINLNRSQLQSHGAPTDKDTKDDTASEDCSRSPNQKHTDQLQASQPISKNSEHSNGDKPNICISDAKESSVGLPAKKKRRMGTCGLTEKERSHFLQVQNGHNGTESAEKQICDKTTHVALEENVSFPSLSGHIAAICVMKQKEPKSEPQTGHCGAAQRPESEVCIAVMGTSDGVVCDPGSSEGKSCEAEEISSPVPELTDNPESHRAEEEEEKHLEDQQLQECKEPTAENTFGMSEKQMIKQQDELAEVNLIITSDTREKEESDNKDTVEVSPPQMNSESGISDDKKEEKTADDAEDEASSADTQSGGLNCGSVKLSEASSVPEIRHNGDPEDDPAAGPSTEHTQTRDPDDTFGSGCSDYVSDSQLNTIVLIEEKMTDKLEKDPDPFGRLEDASDLICGLIRELSTLNRKVMVAHRELENLRRKSSRSSVR